MMNAMTPMVPMVARIAASLDLAPRVAVVPLTTLTPISAEYTGRSQAFVGYRVPIAKPATTILASDERDISVDRDIPSNASVAAIPIHNTVMGSATHLTLP